MEQNEYNKILQLVKSDCPNNRLLGFQLAKGLGYDLMELFSIVNKATKGYGSITCRIGDYLCFAYDINNTNMWLFTIDNLSNNKSIRAVNINACVKSHNWMVVYNDIVKDFINLIINE